MENLGIDPKLLLAQLVNFVLFFILFQRFISKPFLKFLQQERKKEEEKNHSLAAIKKQEETISTMEADMRKKAKKQIDEMLEKAKQDAQHAREEMLTQAKREAEQIATRTHQQLEEERQALYKEVKQKTVELSMLVINDALKEYLTEDAQKKLTQHIMSSVPKDVN